MNKTSKTEISSEKQTIIGTNSNDGILKIYKAPVNNFDKCK
jgi:hypothetical protein